MRSTCQPHCYATSKSNTNGKSLFNVHASLSPLGGLSVLCYVLGVVIQWFSIENGKSKYVQVEKKGQTPCGNATAMQQTQGGRKDIGIQFHNETKRCQSIEKHVDVDLFLILSYCTIIFSFKLSYPVFIGVHLMIENSNYCAASIFRHLATKKASINKLK